MKRTLAALIIIGLTAVQIPALINNLYSFELANGLKVFLVPEPNAEYASLLVYHLTGARDEPAGIQGASFLYQYLIYQKTENLEAGDHFLIMSKTAGAMASRINYDYSSFYKIVPDTEINTVLWLESERLRSLQLDDHILDQQKKLFNSRIVRKRGGSVENRAYNWVHAAILQGTAYEKHLYGDAGNLVNADNSDLLKLYRNFTDPARIILVISGRFAIDELKNLINRYFQSLPAGSRTRPVTFFPAEPRREIIFENWVEADLPYNLVVIGFRFPARISHDQVFTDFLRYYLIDERLSRLDYALNQANNLEARINNDLTDYFEANSFTIQISTRKRIQLEQAKYVLNRELEFIQGTPLKSQDLRTVKTLMELDYLKNLSRPEERSYLIADTFHRYRNLGHLESHLKRIQRITAFDIQRAAKKYLNRDNQVILNVYAE